MQTGNPSKTRLLPHVANVVGVGRVGVDLHRGRFQCSLWARSEAVPVDIPASFGLERRGVWYAIEVGIRGLLVPDEYGRAVAYMICEPASHYYRVMTGSERMPVFIGQRI